MDSSPAGSSFLRLADDSMYSVNRNRKHKYLYAKENYWTKFELYDDLPGVEKY